MVTNWRILAILGVSVVMTGGLGACSNDKLREERSSLALQNDTLKAERDRALTQAQREKTRADALAARPAQPLTPLIEAPKGPSGLEGEKGVTESKNARGEDQIEIEGDVLFDTGKAVIKPSFKKTLDKVAEVIKTQYAGRQLRVEGHTDPRPVKQSGWDDNWDLGAARARAVTLYLINRGVPKKSIYLASFADNALKSTTDFAQDRRVSIVVVK